ncbi:KTSC domain-containing protein [Bradyrhizobium sp. OAE829]|uniref:KTSC domain-containing protein n=1 Tax=Bradyrhizobium sp. OAE829 TaxID=2663807 RepID=UPI001789AB81
MVRIATLLLHLFAAEIGSETVDVRDRGPIDLGTFECRDITRSSIVQRVCYDHARRHLVVALKGAYDQYCDLPAETYDALLNAPSMGGFFNRHIRGQSGAAFACRN